MRKRPVAAEQVSLGEPTPARVAATSPGQARVAALCILEAQGKGLSALKIAGSGGRAWSDLSTETGVAHMQVTRQFRPRTYPVHALGVSKAWPPLISLAASKAPAQPSSGAAIVPGLIEEIWTRIAKPEIHPRLELCAWDQAPRPRRELGVRGKPSSGRLRQSLRPTYESPGRPGRHRLLNNPSARIARLDGIHLISCKVAMDQSHGHDQV